MIEFSISTRKKTEFIEITGRVQEGVQKSGVREGHCIIYCPHTTAAVFSSENADGGKILQDLSNALECFAPKSARYRHNDGNAHSHLKAAVLGNSKTVLVQNGALVLGTWEGLFLAEFDGPRNRKLLVQIVKNP